MNRSFYLTVTALAFLCPAFAQESGNSSVHHSSHAASQSKLSANQIWASLMTGNARFVAGKPQSIDVVALRRKLASGQAPNVIILSCSDSRVSPEVIFDHSLGDLFVVRTAGNIADPVALGSMEYAVDHLHSSLLVVLGHQKCGAVNAACSGDKMPSANLQAIVDKIAPAVTQAKSHAKADELVEAAIKENVHQSAKDVIANSAILSEAVHSGKLQVVEAEYELDTGKVIRLDSSAGAMN
jgi:carbonic anhydrase